MNIKEEIEEKVERLMRIMADQGLAGVLINAQHNFAWLTAGGRNGIDLSREPGAGSPAGSSRRSPLRDRQQDRTVQIND